MTPMKWTKVDLPDGLWRWNVSGYKDGGMTAAVVIRCEDESDRDEIHKLLTEGPTNIYELIPGQAAEIARLKAELAALRDENNNLKAHQSVCHCGVESIRHTISDEHCPVPLIEPCPFECKLAALRERVKPLVEYIRAAAMFGSKWPSNVLRDWEAGEKENTNGIR